MMDACEASKAKQLIQEFSYFYDKDDRKFSNALRNLLALAENREDVKKEISLQIDIDILFLIIDQNKKPKEQITGICKFIDYIFSEYSSYDIIYNFKNQILTSINVNNRDYQHLCLKQLLRFLEDGHNDEYLSNLDLIILTFKYIGVEDISSSTIAIKILNKISDYSQNIEWLLSSEVSSICDVLLGKNTTIRCRVYEIFIVFIRKYPDNLTLFGSKVLDMLIMDLFQNDDILSQLSVLELVSQLAQTGDHAMRFILSKGILNWLQSIIISKDTQNGFLFPSAIKCFGSISYNHPFEIIPKYKSSIDAVFENLKYNEDHSVTCSCAEAIGYLLSNADTLKLLYNNPDALKEAVDRMGEVVTSPAESDIFKVRVLEALAVMFAHDPNDVELSMICEKLYHQISRNPTKFLLEMSKQPFLEIRYGAFKLLRNVSVFNWIEQELALCAGFLEFLIDRRTESEKEGFELKYSIIKNLSLSNTSKDNLGLSYHTEIVKYAKEGPFFKQVELAVSYEQEN